MQAVAAFAGGIAVSLDPAIRGILLVLDETSEHAETPLQTMALPELRACLREAVLRLEVLRLFAEGVYCRGLPPGADR